MTKALSREYNGVGARKTGRTNVTGDTAGALDTAAAAQADHAATELPTTTAIILP
jgi:hypothetical protein